MLVTLSVYENANEIKSVTQFDGNDIVIKFRSVKILHLFNSTYNPVFLLARALVGSVYNATWWGAILPPRISETTGRIRKIQTAFESPVKFVEGNPILLTSRSLMTSQVKSKIKCFAGHGSSRFLGSKMRFARYNIE